MNIGRRSLLSFGFATVGASVVGGQALADPLSAAQRTLSFLNLHTGEAVKTTYFEAGGYVTDALSAVNKVLRDFRTGDSHPMDTRLLDTLSALSAKLGVTAPFEVISGYRSPKTNARLSAASGQVAKRSLHMDGKAIDIRLPGVELKHLRQAAIDLGHGGVGYYPASNFVHIDVGRVRRWQGT